MRHVGLIHINELAQMAGISRKAAQSALTSSGQPYSQRGHDYFVYPKTARSVLAHLKEVARRQRAERRKAVALPKDLPDWQIYFIECESFVKIGIGFSPMERLATFQVGSPFPMRLLCTLEGNTEMELWLHRKFSHYRHRGEWFRHEGELHQFIEALRSEGKGPSEFPTSHKTSSLENALNSV